MRYMKTFFPVFAVVLIYSLILLMSSVPVAQGAEEGLNLGWQWNKKPGEKPDWGVGVGVTISTSTLTDVWKSLKDGDDDDDTDSESCDSESCDSDKPDWAKDSGSCDSPPPPESSSDDDEEESPSGGDVNIENFGNVEGDDNDVKNKIKIKISQ